MSTVSCTNQICHGVSKKISKNVSYYKVLRGKRCDWLCSYWRCCDAINNLLFRSLSSSHSYLIHRHQPGMYLAFFWIVIIHFANTSMIYHHKNRHPIWPTNSFGAILECNTSKNSNERGIFQWQLAHRCTRDQYLYKGYWFLFEIT